MQEELATPSTILASLFPTWYRLVAEADAAARDAHSIGGDDNATEKQKGDDDDDDDDDDHNESDAQQKTTNSDDSDGPSFLKLLSLVVPHWVPLTWGCMLLLLRLPFNMALPHFTSVAITAAMAQEHEKLVHSLSAYVVCGAANAFLDFFNVYLFDVTRNRIVHDLRRNLYAAALKQECAYHDKCATGDLASRISTDTRAMADKLTWVFRFFLEAIVRTGGVMGYMLFMCWPLALVAISIVPITTQVNRIYGQFQYRISAARQDAAARCNARAHESLSAIRTVMSLGAENMELRRFDRHSREVLSLANASAIVDAGYYSVVFSFCNGLLVPAAVLVYGCYLVYHRQHAMDGQKLFAFFLYQGQLQEWFGQLINCASNLYESSGTSRMVFNLLDRKPRRSAYSDDGDSSATHSFKARGGKAASANADVTTSAYGTGAPPPALEMRRVWFKHGAVLNIADERYAIRDVTLSVASGDQVALVGPSGSGKSTMFHLWLRFYEPTDGSVMVLGRDIRKYTRDELYGRLIGYVGQEPVLFSGSVAFNIAYSLLKDKGELAAQLEEDADASSSAWWSNRVREEELEGVKESKAAAASLLTNMDDVDLESPLVASSSAPSLSESDGGNAFAASFEDARRVQLGRALRRWLDADGGDDSLSNRVVASARLANALGFIERLPLGFDSEVGERGVRFSGGQKQRIAIARAVCANPAILLLDEATSALDTESERVVQEALDATSVGRTVVAIAHRLATVRSCCAWHVLRDGALVASGTPSEVENML